MLSDGNVEDSRRSPSFSAKGTTTAYTCTAADTNTRAVMLSAAGVGFTDHRFIMERPVTGTGRGAPKRNYGAVKMITARLVFLLLLPSLSTCVPQASQVQITSSDGTFTPELANPFGSGEDNRRLLQSYIKSNLKEGQNSPELNTREQEVFFLFSLYDYDRSGQMDGLELMQLLTDFLSYHAITPKSTDYVVSLVDYLLQSQDLNQDGLLVPSELLSSSTLHPEGNIATPDAQVEPVKRNEEQMDMKTDETHQEEAEIHDTQETEQEQDQLVEHNEPQEPAQEPTDLNQVLERLQEHQDGIQSPDEKFQDEHQE